MSMDLTLSAPVPPVLLGPDEILTQSQWATLFSLADTVIPSIQTGMTEASKERKCISTVEYEAAVTDLNASKADGQITELANRYLAENLSSNLDFQPFIQRLLSQYLHEEGRKGIVLVLRALNSRAGSLLLTGSSTLIQHQPFDVRERIFQNWARSRFQPLRKAHRAFLLIFKKVWTSISPTLGPVIGITSSSSIEGKRADGTDFRFLQFYPGSGPVVIETDVVIVGSGCGGSVAAQNLAKDGHRVVVVEKSYYHPTKHFPMGPSEGYINLFESGGTLTTDDGTMAVLAGSTWGGGGTINWSACLQTQSYVRDEWSRNGLDFFTSQGFQDSLDRVCHRMGVNMDQIEHNHANRVTLTGAEKLGYSAKAVPQNTGNSKHYCGHCAMGCPSAMKKGPRESFLADAAASGALFVEGFNAQKVLFEPSTSSGSKVAVGVEGVWTTRESHFNGEPIKRRVIIKAKNVVVSCGTLQSPLLLLRSGIRNPHIGRHLYLHPVVASFAVFEDAVLPWEGSALTSVVTDLENLDGKGHGVKIENPTMLPGAIGPLFPWRNGLEYKLLASKLRNMAGFISLCRDRDSGRVYPDPVDGRCRINYSVSAFDQRHIVEGLIACAKIAYISGAKEYHTSCTDIPPFIRTTAELDGLCQGINDPALQKWISDLRKKLPLNNENAVFASAHQMGTCRMGTSPLQSVVDPNGQVWGTKGLFVADASVFPSASGVNPMLTNMAISDRISQKLSSILGKGKGESVAKRDARL